MGEAYIVAATRTAGGKRGGLVSRWHPADLAGEVLNGLVDRAGADPALIEDVIMGCVIQAGEQSLNVARGAVMSSKLPLSVPGTSVDRQCGSSQQALHFDVGCDGRCDRGRRRKHEPRANGPIVRGTQGAWHP
jgi:acetyl-CoA C-acetyltransferase